MLDIDKLNSLIARMEGLLGEMKELARERAVAPPTHFDKLKELLRSTDWPVAVNQNLIADPDSESDRVSRANGILDFVVKKNVAGLKLLDFGCGDGYCPRVACDRGAALSVGYDVKEDPTWDNSRPKAHLTTDFGFVKENGPYDVVVLFDVIDHVGNGAAKKILSSAKSVLAPGGQMFLRCHPFTSRHATHLYRKINKAYLHLVFTPAELAELVPDGDHGQGLKVVTPIKLYNELLAAAGLKIVRRKDFTEKVEPFFQNTKLVRDRILATTGMKRFPEFQMSVQFIDYVLSAEPHDGPQPVT